METCFKCQTQQLCSYNNDAKYVCSSCQGTTSFPEPPMKMALESSKSIFCGEFTSSWRCNASSNSYERRQKKTRYPKDQLVHQTCIKCNIGQATNFQPLCESCLTQCKSTPCQICHQGEPCYPANNPVFCVQCEIRRADFNLEHTREKHRKKAEVPK